MRIVLIHPCSADPAQHASAEPDREEHLEKLDRWNAVRVQQTCDSRDHYTRFVCRVAWRRDRTLAYFRRSNPALRTDRTWLDASRSSGRRFHDGFNGGVSPADETSRQNIAMVCHGFRNRDHTFRFVENALVIARPVVSYRRI